MMHPIEDVVRRLLLPGRQLAAYMLGVPQRDAAAVHELRRVAFSQLGQRPDFRVDERLGVRDVDGREALGRATVDASRRNANSVCNVSSHFSFFINRICGASNFQSVAYASKFGLCQ